MSARWLQHAPDGADGYKAFLASGNAEDPAVDVDPDLARRVQELLAPLPVVLDTAWGLDHGTWSVLKHAYPAADVPVVQLSIDETRPPAFHYDL